MKDSLTTNTPRITDDTSELVGTHSQVAGTLGQQAGRQDTSEPSCPSACLSKSPDDVPNAFDGEGSTPEANRSRCSVFPSSETPCLISTPWGPSCPSTDPGSASTQPGAIWIGLLIENQAPSPFFQAPWRFDQNFHKETSHAERTRLAGVLSWRYGTEMTSMTRPSEGILERVDRATNHLNRTDPRLVRTALRRAVLPPASIHNAAGDRTVVPSDLQRTDYR